MISIIIPTFNQLPFTRLCLQFVKKYTKEPYELIVVDNGSTDGTVAFLQKYPGIKLITFPDNRGFATACNAGLKVSRGRYIVLLNNDVLVTPFWLTNLIRVLDSRPDVGMSLPVTNLTYGPQCIQVSYSNLEAMVHFARNYNRSNPGRWMEVPRLPNYCLIIRREMTNKIGLLDEQFSPGYFEDDDYSYRARQAGYRLIFTEDTFVHHFSGTTTSTVNKNSNMGEINRKRFYKKWKVNPLNFFKLEMRILNPLPDGLFFTWGKQPYLFQGGSLCLISSGNLLPLFSVFQEKIPHIGSDLYTLYPISHTFEDKPFLDGIILASVGNEDDDLYILHAKQRRPVKDPLLLKCLKKNCICSSFVSMQLLECLPKGPEFNLSAGSGLPGGLLLQCGSNYYVSSENMLRPLTQIGAKRWGYALGKALPLEPEHLNQFAFGPPILDHVGLPMSFANLTRVIDQAKYNNRQLAGQYNLLYPEAEKA